MSETEKVEFKDSPAEIETYWHHAPTYMVDGVLGSAWAGGLHRIMLGEICLNITPGSDIPANRPVANVVMTTPSVRALITYLQRLPGVSEQDEQADS